jgi:hypothetical protein
MMIVNGKRQVKAFTWNDCTVVGVRFVIRVFPSLLNDCGHVLLLLRLLGANNIPS